MSSPATLHPHFWGHGLWGEGWTVVTCRAGVAWAISSCCCPEAPALERAGALGGSQGLQGSTLATQMGLVGDKGQTASPQCHSEGHY